MIKKSSRIKFVFSCIIISVLIVTSVYRNSIWDSELSLWSDVLKKAPNNHRAHYQVALYYHHSEKKYNKALFHLMRIIELNKQNWFVVSEIGSVFADMGLFNDALAWHGRAREMSDSADIWSFFGITYVKMNERDKAIQAFEKALRLQPDSAATNYHLAALFRDSDPEKAKTHFENALRLNPDYYEAIIDFANLLDDRGDSEKAFSLYREAVERYPDSPESYYNLGVFYERRGDAVSAIENYNKALSINQNYHEPLERLRGMGR